MKCFMYASLFLLAVFFSFPRHVSAQIYKYQDKDGSIHFTSDPNAIPEEGKILKSFEEENKNNPQGKNTPEDYPPAMMPTVQMLQTILQLYHATHTYNEADLFVCADMAKDVWNMVKTKGVNARIVAGNVNKTDAEGDEFNHAWVVAEAAPRKWIALETTGGFLVSREKNKNYYRGYLFATPRELEEYLEARRQGKGILELHEKYNKVYEEYNQELKKFNEMVNAHNQKYPNRLLPLGQFKEAQANREKINQQRTVVQKLEGRLKQLNELLNSNIEKQEAFEQALNKSIETVPSN